jgi:hypothetical protein
VAAFKALNMALNSFVTRDRCARSNPPAAALSPSRTLKAYRIVL